MKDFKDKVLVVTGAGSGIGAAIAKEGAGRGMKVVINDIDPDGADRTLKAVEGLGAEAVVQVADISLLENVEKLHALSKERFGQVDMLVNNAGVAVSTPIWEVPTQDIQWITEANLLSHAYGMRLFMPEMIQRGTEAVVLNVASTAGIMVSPNGVMYHATKAADVALAESTYLGLQARGIQHIQVHVLCPAYIKTTIHESDKHRPERYSDMSAPYYQGQEYKASIIRGTRSVLGGIPIDSVGMTVFSAIEENNFYIFTHPESIIPAGQKISWMATGKNPG